MMSLAARVRLRISRLGREQSGQAMLEVLMLSWVVLLLIGAGFQLYLVNRTIFRSMSTGHYLLMKSAFDRNCSQQRDVCRWMRGNVILDPQSVPEVRMPRLTIFNRAPAMPTRLYTLADYRPGDGDIPVCSEKSQFWCIRLNIGAGTYQGFFSALADGVGGYQLNSQFLREVIEQGVASFVRNSINSIWEKFEDM